MLHVHFSDVDTFCWYLLFCFVVLGYVLAVGDTDQPPPLTNVVAVTAVVFATMLARFITFYLRLQHVAKFHFTFCSFYLCRFFFFAAVDFVCALCCSVSVEVFQNRNSSINRFYGALL